MRQAWCGCLPFVASDAPVFQHAAEILEIPQILDGFWTEDFDSL